MTYLVVILCGVLFAWGGYNFLLARRYILPLLLALSCLLITHDWLCLTMLASCLGLSLGYGDNSFFRHCFGNGWGRGVWGLIVSLCLSTSLYLTGHLHWYWLAVYLSLGFTLENALKNINQLSGDFIIGCGFGSIVLMIH